MMMGIPEKLPRGRSAGAAGATTTIVPPPAAGFTFTVDGLPANTLIPAACPWYVTVPFVP